MIFALTASSAVLENYVHKHNTKILSLNICEYFTSVNFSAPFIPDSKVKKKVLKKRLAGTDSSSI